MAVAVGVHEVVGAEYARERSCHRRIVEDPLDRGHPGNEVVAGIALLLEQRVRPVPHLLVEITWEAGLDDYVPVADEAAHLVVGQRRGLRPLYRRFHGVLLPYDRLAGRLYAGYDRP